METLYLRMTLSASEEQAPAPTGERMAKSGITLVIFAPGRECEMMTWRWSNHFFPDEAVSEQLGRAARAAVFTLGSLVIAFAAWYGVSFLPHLREVKLAAAQGSASAAGIENVLYPLAVAAESKEGIRSWAARQAYWSLAYHNDRKGMLAWHGNWALWEVAIRLNLNERDVFGLWVNCAISNCGYGLQEAAQRHFGRSLGELSDLELAGLVAAVRSPEGFAPGSERGMRRAKEILEKARNRE